MTAPLHPKLFSGPISFLKSAPQLQFLPDPKVPEIAFAGRSNVGKSSLINAMTNRNGLARTSNTPGRTQELNFFDIGDPLIFRICIKPVDEEVMEMLDKAAVSYRVVMTKADKVKQEELDITAEKVAAIAKKHPAAHPDLILTSSEKKQGIDELRLAVLEAVQS